MSPFKKKNYFAKTLIHIGFCFNSNIKGDPLKISQPFNINWTKLISQGIHLSVCDNLFKNCSKKKRNSNFTKFKFRTFSLCIHNSLISVSRNIDVNSCDLLIQSDDIFRHSKRKSDRTRQISGQLTLLLHLHN